MANGTCQAREQVTNAFLYLYVDASERVSSNKAGIYINNRSVSQTERSPTIRP